MKKGGAWRRQTLLAAVSLALAGCALPGAVHRAQIKADEAMAKSDTALNAARADARREQAQEQSLRAEMARVIAGEATLRRELAVHAVQKQKAAAAKATKAQIQSVFAMVIDRARTLAKSPYKAPVRVASVLRKLSYTDYNKVHLSGPVPGWMPGGRFHLRLYPAGYLFQWPEKIFIVRDGKATLLRQTGQVAGDPALAHALHGVAVPPAGFSVYTPLTSDPASVNEFLSFLGASYFRALGAGQHWGLSARGLAIDTALPHRAEEFPYFRAFWIIPPRPQAHRLRFCALLDSPGLTGAYRFVVTPGRTTVVAVKTVLFERHAVHRLGIAPLTSMFLQGRFSDKRYRKLILAAHDSDGLLIKTGPGARLWWPLRDPSRLALYRFPLTNPEGFGLMQRPRKADDYRAFGMHYAKRPSAWVKPVGSWGAGHLLLIELPTTSQTNDNISVFWVPKHQAPPGHPMTFAYTISWRGTCPQGRRLGYVVATRHRDKKDGRETFVINFAGGRLARLAPTTVVPQVHVSGPARVVHAWAAPDGSGGNWRLQFTVVPTGSGQAVVHAALASKGVRLTETWADIFPLP